MSRVLLEKNAALTLNPPLPFSLYIHTHTYVLIEEYSAFQIVLLWLHINQYWGSKERLARWGEWEQVISFPLTVMNSSEHKLLVNAGTSSPHRTDKWCLSCATASRLEWVSGLTALQGCFQTSRRLHLAEPCAVWRFVLSSNSTLPLSLFPSTGFQLGSCPPVTSSLPPSPFLFFKSLDYVLILRNLSIQLIKDLSVPGPKNNDFFFILYQTPPLVASAGIVIEQIAATAPS